MKTLMKESYGDLKISEVLSYNYVQIYLSEEELKNFVYGMWEALQNSYWKLWKSRKYKIYRKK